MLSVPPHSSCLSLAHDIPNGCLRKIKEMLWLEPTNGSPMGNRMWNKITIDMFLQKFENIEQTNILAAVISRCLGFRTESRAVAHVGVGLTPNPGQPRSLWCSCKCSVRQQKGFKISKKQLRGTLSFKKKTSAQLHLQVSSGHPWPGLLIGQTNWRRRKTNSKTVKVKEMVTNVAQPKSLKNLTNLANEDWDSSLKV